MVGNSVLGSAPADPVHCDGAGGDRIRAHAQHKVVVVHADSGASARMALDAGADALAHHPNEADPAGDLVDRLRAYDRFVIPTLKVPAGFAPGRSGAAGGNDDLL